MNKIILFLFGIFFTLNCLATKYYVNNNSITGDVFCTAVGNNTNNGTSPSTPKLTFRGLWTSYGPFANGDTIYVDDGTYTSSIAGSQTQNFGYSITKNITIIGAGNTRTIFDNNYCGIAGNYYFADVNSGANLIMKDIQLTKYASNNDGQCLQITGANVTLTNVLTNSNGGSSRYGTITVNSNSTLNITGGGINCNGDVSHGASGGIDVKGTNITVNVTNCSFIDNYKNSSAQLGNGGTITVTSANNTTIVNITNCLFDGSFVDNDNSGGGTFYQTSGILNVTSCKVTNSKTYQNSVKYGGVYYGIGSGKATFKKCFITSNVNNGGSTYGTMSLNGATASLTIDSCYFSSNRSDRGNDLYTRSGTITATRTTFASVANQCAVYGGNITLTNCGTPVLITNNTGTFTNNGGTPPSFTNPTVQTYTGTCATAIALPIELLYFKPYLEDGVIKFKWVTASEQNNDFFTIEKSLDGTNFSIITKLPGAGNSSTMTTYTSVDRNPTLGISYYRLKQTDYNGRFERTDWYSVNIEKDINGLLIYPNPIGNKIHIECNSFLEKEDYLYIFDVSGKLIFTEKIILVHGDNSIVVELPDFSPGVYSAKLGTSQIKITK